MLCLLRSPFGSAGTTGVAPTVVAPVIEVRCVVHASFIHSDREIFRFSHDLSMVAVRSSSIVTEYRTILDRFAGAPDRFFDYYGPATQRFITRDYPETS